MRQAAAGPREPRRRALLAGGRRGSRPPLHLGPHGRSRRPDCWYVSANPGARLAHYGEQSTEAYLYRWRGGGPWEPLGGRLPQPLDSFPYALAADSDSLFAGLGDGRIYRSEDRGEHWEQLDMGGELPTGVLALILIRAAS
jgi:hypothetical protein